MNKLTPYSSKDQCLIILEGINDGLGDTQKAFGVAQDIQKEFGCSVVIATNLKKDAELFNKKTNFQVIDLAEATPEKVGKVAFQVVVPVCRYTPRLDSLPKFKVPILLLYEDSLTPYLLPKEFNGCVTSKAFGLGENEIGLFLDSELLEWSNSPESKNPMKKLEKLNACHPKLKTALLKELEKNPLFYTGYASDLSTLKLFILSMVLLNRENSRPLLFYFPKNFPSLFFEESKFIQFLKQYGIGEIHLKKYQQDSKPNEELSISEKELQTFLNLQKATLYREDKVANKTEEGSFLEESSFSFDPSKKSLTIIQGATDPEDMKQILMATEPETVVTGVGSTELAISTNKSFIYESRPHKKELSEKLSACFQKERSDSFKADLSLNFEDIEKRPLDFPKQNLIKQAYVFFATNKKEDYQSTSRFNQRISLHHNASPKIGKFVRELLERFSFPFEILYSDKPLSASDIPFDRPLLVHENQFDQLKIDRQTQKSRLVEFENSKFEYHYLGETLYFLKRVHS